MKTTKNVMSKCILVSFERNNYFRKHFAGEIVYIFFFYNKPQHEYIPLNRKKVQ